MPKTKERETESRQKQDDRKALSRIKAWQGLMEHHIKHANWKQKDKRNGKYETAADALNPQLWCINRIMEEASLVCCMTNPYNTRARKKLVYSRKENRERATTTHANRARPQSSPQSSKLSRRLTLTTMAPPKSA
jgi:hypothetical protein